MSAGVRVMAARFASTCSACDGAIRAGDQIRYVRNMVATHDRCGDPSVALERRSGGRSTNRGGYVRCSHIDYPCCGCGS